mmetsp:Transcript_2850/g.4427  ORF Transcript_2850/g.4427 Transcript_2850/m.4427 type:complete len:223 (-) Transcript_2850:190-858(-)
MLDRLGSTCSSPGSSMKSWFINSLSYMLSTAWVLLRSFFENSEQCCLTESRNWDLALSMRACVRLILSCSLWFSSSSSSLHEGLLKLGRSFFWCWALRSLSCSHSIISLESMASISWSNTNSLPNSRELMLASARASVSSTTSSQVSRSSLILLSLKSSAPFFIPDKYFSMNSGIPFPWYIFEHSSLASFSISWTLCQKVPCAFWTPSSSRGSTSSSYLSAS